MLLCLYFGLHWGKNNGIKFFIHIVCVVGPAVGGGHMGYFKDYVKTDNSLTHYSINVNMDGSWKINGE